MPELHCSDDPRAPPCFCYVLVDDNSDSLCEATWISGVLLRRIYEAARIVVICDIPTEKRLLSKRLNFQHSNIELLATDIPFHFVGSAIRSRFLKTQIRSLINGDLVFLDADAIPLRPFDTLFRHDCQFAAVLDRNRENTRPHMPIWVEPIYRRFGWTYPLPNYFNSGVMFLRDDSDTRELGRLWHQRWNQVLSEFGKHQDQPALNSSLHDLGLSTKILPVSYNAMVDASPCFARNAKIVHYFFSGRQGCFDPDSLLQHLIDEFTRTGRIEWQKHQNSLERGDCWIHPTNSIAKELVSGNYLRAANLLIRRAGKRLGWS
jgi:hypothetical protein